MVVEIPIDQIPPGDRPAQLALFKADDNTPTYYFEGTDKDAQELDAILLGLDHLHAFYQLNRESLASAHARRVEEAAALEAELARNPPQPVDTVVHFWKLPAATP